MSAGVWYVDDNRAPLDLGTAVTAGAATVDVHRIVVDDAGHERRYLWARAGQAVTLQRVALALEEQSPGSPPALPVPTPRPPTLTQKVTDLTGALTALADDVDVRLGQVEDVTDGFATQISDAVTQASAATTAANAAAAAAADVVDDVAALETTVGTLPGQVTTLSGQVSDLAGDVAAVSGLPATVTALDGELDGLSTQVAAFPATFAPKDGIHVADHAVGDDVADDTTGLNAAAALAITTGKPLIFPPQKTYRITGPVDFRGHLLRIYGNDCTIRQHTANTAGVMLGGTGQVVDGLRVDYAAAPTSGHTGANAITFHSVFVCSYSNLTAERTARGFYMPQSSWDGSGTNTMFSSVFTNLHCNGWTISAIDFSSFPAGGVSSTGNVINSAYLHNNYTGSIATTAGPPVLLVDHDEGVWNQVNIEWCDLNGQPAMFLQRCRNVIFNSPHFEQLTLRGNNAFIRAFDQIGLTMQSPHMVFCTIEPGADVKSFLFPGFTGAYTKARINGLKIRDLTTTSVTAWAAVEMWTGSGGDIEIDADPDTTAAFIGPWVRDDTYPSPVVKRVGARDFTARHYTAPADLGYRSWSFDPRLVAATGIAPTAGTIYVTRLKVPEFLASGSVWTDVLHVVQAGTGATSLANCFVGVARADTLARIGVSTNRATQWATVGVKETALTLTADKPEGVDLLAVVLVGTQSTTPVQFARAGADTADLANGRVAAAAAHHATANTGVTAIPTTVGTLALSSVALYRAGY